MTLQAPLLDFADFKKLGLINKYEYFLTNKVFSEIYKVQEKDTGEIYTANISRPEEKKKDSKAFKRIISILPQLNHPSILHFIGYSKFEQDGKSYSAVITDYFSNGTLKDSIAAEISGNPVQGWNDTKKLITIYGIASGMAYMHSKNVLHRNLKPVSIVMDKSFYPKIRNFNLIIKCDDESCKKPIKTTPEYTAPEIIMREPSSKPMDVYAFGMIVYEIVTLHHPYEEIENLNVVHVIQKVGNGQLPEFPKSTPIVYQKLIKRCWAKNPDERPTFDEIVLLLRTNPEFVTENVKKDEYFKYINYLDQYTNKKDKESANNYISDDEGKEIREQIKLKTEEIKKLKENLIDHDKKLHDA